MNLSPPEHIIGPLQGPGATARRAERREWILARAGEGHPVRQIAHSLDISQAVVAEQVRWTRRKNVDPVTRPAEIRQNVRAVAVPYVGTGISSVAFVSLSRSPWDEPEGRVAPRPETDPPRAARPLAKLPPRKLSAYQRVRAAIQEEAER